MLEFFFKLRWIARIWGYLWWKYKFVTNGLICVLGSIGGCLLCLTLAWFSATMKSGSTSCATTLAAGWRKRLTTKSSTFADWKKQEKNTHIVEELWRHCCPRFHFVQCFFFVSYKNGCVHVSRSPLKTKNGRGRNPVNLKKLIGIILITIRRIDFYNTWERNQSQFFFLSFFHSYFLSLTCSTPAINYYIIHDIIFKYLYIIIFAEIIYRIA